jgi:hypothetical protein
MPPEQSVRRTVYQSARSFTKLQTSAVLPHSGVRFHMTQYHSITSLNSTNQLVFVIGRRRVFREVETSLNIIYLNSRFQGIKNILSLNLVISNFHPATFQYYPSITLMFLSSQETETSHLHSVLTGTRDTSHLSFSHQSHLPLYLSDSYVLFGSMLSGNQQSTAFYNTPTPRRRVLLEKLHSVSYTVCSSFMEVSYVNQFHTLPF